MTTYGNFENFEGVEFTDPAISSAFVNGLFPDEMKINVSIVFDIPNTNGIGVQLDGVTVNNLDYNETELSQRITEHLNEYHLISNQ